MLATWSVRTYNFILRYGMEIETQEQAISAGNLVMEGKIRNAGLKCAIELYRAGGLGVYQIEKKLNYRKSHEAVVNECNYLDRYVFHYDMEGLD